jgi:hypothetical protein
MQVDLIHNYNFIFISFIIYEEKKIYNIKEFLLCHNLLFWAQIKKFKFILSFFFLDIKYSEKNP